MDEKTETAAMLQRLDEMSKDLLLLTRTVSIYPEGHPNIRQMAERLANWAKTASGDDGMTVGVTGNEMVVDGQFYGGTETRVEFLAKRLHEKSVAKLTWKKEISEKEVYSFARLLADSSLTGELLSKALEEKAIDNIKITPLDVGALHDRMRLIDVAYNPLDVDRRKRLWQLLQESAGNPRQLGEAIKSEDFWLDSLSDDPLVRAEFVEMLAGVGSMIDRALLTIDEEDRAPILEKISALGKNLKHQELAKLAANYLEDESPNDFALNSLMRHADGERLAGVLGGMVAMGAGREKRVALFLKKFVPPDSLMGLAGLVRDWQSTGSKLGFSSEIWKWLESYLLNVDENQYMADGYKATLDRMAEKMRLFGARAAGFGFYEDPEAHIDNVCAGLAMADYAKGEKILTDRIIKRMGILDGPSAVSFLSMVDNTVPQILENHPEIFEKVFREMISGVKDFPERTKEQIAAFAKNHEDKALEIILRSLANEQRISTRRFLVEVLARLSKSALPKLVLSAKNAPWYYVRNIVIVLGLMADARAAPFLGKVLEAQNPKLRKEALRSLGKIGDSQARALLISYSSSLSAPSDEAKLAKAIAQRLKTS